MFKLGQCEKCSEPAVASSEDGESLCEDCIFEKMCEDMFEEK